MVLGEEAGVAQALWYIQTHPELVTAYVKSRLAMKKGKKTIIHRVKFVFDYYYMVNGDGSFQNPLALDYMKNHLFNGDEQAYLQFWAKWGNEFQRRYADPS